MNYKLPKCSSKNYNLKQEFLPIIHINNKKGILNSIKRNRNRSFGESMKLYYNKDISPLFNKKQCISIKEQKEIIKKMRSVHENLLSLYSAFNDICISKLKLIKSRREIVIAFLSIICKVLELPINTANIQGKSLEFIGDILIILKEYKNALFYYIYAVIFF